MITNIINNIVWFVCMFFVVFCLIELAKRTKEIEQWERVHKQEFFEVHNVLH